MIYNIQALRAFAALLVLFVHADDLFRPLGVTPTGLRFGHVGVDLFFVISGFVMVHTSRSRPPTAGSFMVNRLVRVAPMYWLLTAVVFGVALVAPAVLKSTRPDAVELLKSLLFVPFRKASGLDEPVLFVGWTLNYEMFFYLLFAIMLWLTRGALRRTVAGVVVALLLVVSAAATVGDAGTVAGFYGNPIVLEFAYGMAVALLVEWGWLPTGAGAAALLVAGGAALVGLPFALPMDERWLSAGLPAAVMVIAAVALDRYGRRARAPVVQLLGAASYMLYLVHPFVLRAMARVGGDRASLTLVVLAFLAAQAAAILLHLGLERPVTAWLRSRVGHRRSVVDQAERAAGRPGATEGSDIGIARR